MNKEQEFYELLKRLHNDDFTFEKLKNKYTTITFSLFLASRLWIDEKPENDDTKEFRRQIKFLEENGHWDF